MSEARYAIEYNDSSERESITQRLVLEIKALGQRNVVLFDSNPFNPYGAELASVLAEAGFSVTRWCRVGDPFRENIRHRRVLAASRHQVGLVRAVFSRVWGSLLFALTALTRRNNVTVFVWPHDRLVISLAILLVRIGAPVVYIDHNPLLARPLPPASEKLLRRLRGSRAIRVVHGHALAEQITPRPAFVAHPSYRRWVRQFDASANPKGKRQALFLGALRADKGADQLPGIIDELLANDVDVLIAGNGSCPGLKVKDKRLKFVGNGRNLSDEEIAAALRQSSVLIAPYRDVTMSGSIIMALTAGLPVATYDGPTLRHVLPPAFLVESGDPGALARRAIQLAERSRWGADLADLVTRMDESCAAAWREILFPRHL